MGLFDSNGCCQDDEFVVKSIIGSYFREIFSLANPSNMTINMVVDCIPTRVTTDMNDYLLKPFVAEEVQNAIFGMTPSKF